MDTATEKAVTEALEALIDQHGLLHVVTGLELVCGEKADHLRSNWQDRDGAKLWERDARTLRGILTKIINH
jgi:hypothetical protein